MSDEPDANRLSALEARIKAARAAATPDATRAPEAVSQAQMAWRMIIELVAGIGIGVGMGWGLDLLFGTAPWLMIVFTLFGLAAGVKVMLETARELNPGAGPAAGAGTGPAAGNEGGDGAEQQHAGPRAGQQDDTGPGPRPGADEGKRRD